MLPKVSIIVPVFNVEKYISRCLKSLLNQTYSNYEVIIVDDASPDNSISIINELMSYYDNIKLIRLPQNKGLANARNLGLLHSSGEYIIHIDSDDYCELTMIEMLVDKALETKSDIVISDFYITKANKDIYCHQSCGFSGLDNIRLILQGKLHGANWNKLIKRDLYFENEIMYIQGVDMYEDVITITRLLYYANNVAYLNRAFVHYVQYNPNAYTNLLNDKIISNTDKVNKYLFTLFIEDKREFELESALETFKFNTILHLIKQSNSIESINTILSRFSLKMTAKKNIKNMSAINSLIFFLLKKNKRLALLAVKMRVSIKKNFTI